MNRALNIPRGLWRAPGPYPYPEEENAMPRGKRKTEPESMNGHAAEAPEKDAPGPGHNSKNARPELTEEQRQALFFHWKKRYEAALAVKKKADADFKNACKAAKAELGDDAVASIKDALLLETEEGEAELRAGIERQMRVARWMAVPLGAQADLFADATDRRPATERAHAEGVKAGMEGKPCISPYDPPLPQREEWLAGWREGQAALFSAQRWSDGKVFDDAEPPLAEGEAAPQSVGA